MVVFETQLFYPENTRLYDDLSDNDHLRTYSWLALADPGILRSAAEILLKSRPIPVGFSLTTTIPEELMRGCRRPAEL